MELREGITTIKELFRHDIQFVIPGYQRNYAWIREKQLNDYWEDLYNLATGKKYFMGTMLLRFQKTGESQAGFSEFERWEIIDGQQRAITTAIFLRVATRMLRQQMEMHRSLNESDRKEWLEDIKEIESRYLAPRGYQKLIPLGEDEDYFRRHILNYEDYPNETATPSQKRIKEARIFFEEKCKSVDNAEVAGLMKKVEAARIVIYPVKEADEAVLIFETVNDRGKPLTNLEKIKSFLMYMVYLSAENAQKIHDDLNKSSKQEWDKAMKELEASRKLLHDIQKRFGRIFRYFDQIERMGYDIGEDDILRYHFVLWDTDKGGNPRNSYSHLQFTKDGFRVLLHEDRKRVPGRVLDYVTTLEQVFNALKDVLVDVASGNNRKHLELKSIVNKLIRLNRLGNFYPLAIALWLRFHRQTSKLTKVFDAIEKFVFRVYLIGRRQSDTAINRTYEWAYLIFREDMSMEELNVEIRDLAGKYISDKDFKIKLGEYNFYDAHQSIDLRYLFYHYEESMRKSQGEPVDISLDNILSTEFSIEHILAQELAEKDWPKDIPDAETFENNLHRIGNLTLASRKWNSSYGNRSFSRKKTCTGKKGKEKDRSAYRCYQKSVFKCQQELADYSKFGFDEIDKRSKELIDFCVGRWKF